MTTDQRQLDEEVPSGFRRVEINREPIELHKILKFEGMAGSGGQAKQAVASGQVLVNGKPELQKRKKIVSGDTIEFNQKKICIKFAPTAPAVEASQRKEGNPESGTAPETPEPEQK